MSELAQIEDALLNALGEIRGHWRALLVLPTTAGGTASTDDVTALDKRLSLAGEVTASLNGWARLIVEERDLSHGLPLGHDALGLIEFLERWARWFSGHEGAPAAVDELTGWASKVSLVVEPPVKEWVYLGDCPFVLDFGGDLDLTIASTDPPFGCTGRVRSPIGGDESTATCTDCGEYGPVEWWEEVLGIGQAPVSAERMAQILHERMGVRVTGRTVRNWLRAGTISAYVEPFGPEPQWPRYDPRRVMDEVARMGRACAVCGQAWDGEGDVCRQCWPSVAIGKPRYAERKETPRAPVNFRPARRSTAPDPHDTNNPRCYCCDLDTRWCYYHRSGA